MKSKLLAGLLAGAVLTSVSAQAERIALLGRLAMSTGRTEN